MLPPCTDFSPPPPPSNFEESPSPRSSTPVGNPIYGQIRCLSTPFRVNTPQQSEEDVGIYYTKVYQSDIVP